MLIGVLNNTRAANAAGFSYNPAGSKRKTSLDLAVVPEGSKFGEPADIGRYLNRPRSSDTFIWSHELCGNMLLVYSCILVSISASGNRVYRPRNCTMGSKDRGSLSTHSAGSAWLGIIHVSAA